MKERPNTFRKDNLIRKKFKYFLKDLIFVFTVDICLELFVNIKSKSIS